MIQDIIICILFILIIYYIFKKNPEHFSIPDTENLNLNIKNYVDENYNNKIKYLNTVLNFIEKNNKNNQNLIINSSKLINTKNINAGQLKTTGSNKFKNLTINGDLNINGFLKINYDIGKNKVQIIPRFMIVAWCNNIYKKDNNKIILDIPYGWALCDGGVYNYNKEGKIIKVYDSSGIKTPDLRNRFIIGAASNSFSYPNQEEMLRGIPEDQASIINIPAYEFGNTYGNYTYTIKSTDLPPHRHFFSTKGPAMLNKNADPNILKLYTNKLANTSVIQDSYYLSTGLSLSPPGGYNMGDPNQEITYVKTDNEGKEKPTPINIVPQHMSLFYIMKI